MLYYIRCQSVKNRSMRKILPFLCLVAACSGPVDQRRAVTEQAVNAFFEHYKTRADWEGFQDLFAEDLVFEDVIFHFTYNKQEFIDFYNWPDSLLKKHPDYPEVMVVEDLAFTDSTAIGRGYFTPFYYNGILYDDWEHMRFVMALHVNNEGKITRHIDFIEYPPDFLIQAGQSIIAADSTAGN